MMNNRHKCRVCDIFDHKNWPRHHHPKYVLDGDGAFFSLRSLSLNPVLYQTFFGYVCKKAKRFSAQTNSAGTPPKVRKARNVMRIK